MNLRFDSNQDDVRPLRQKVTGMSGFVIRISGGLVRSKQGAQFLLLLVTAACFLITYLSIKDSPLSSSPKPVPALVKKVTP